MDCRRLRASAAISACRQETLRGYNEDQIQVMVSESLSTRERSLYCSIYRVTDGSKDEPHNHSNVTSARVRDRPDIKRLIDPYSAEESEDSSKSER